MNALVTLDTSVSDVAELDLGPRIVVILHPNDTRIDITVNDRMFNHEQYNFSRKQEAEGAEKELLDFCGTQVVGISSAKACKNTLALEIDDGMYMREYMPRVIEAVKRWGNSFGPYEPTLYVENRRYDISPVYEEYSCKDPGVKQSPTAANIGMPYKVWVAGQ